jgi:hypothetical protein
MKIPSSLLGLQKRFLVFIVLLFHISPRGYEIPKYELKVVESEITQICKL